MNSRRTVTLRICHIWIKTDSPFPYMVILRRHWPPNSRADISPVLCYIRLFWLFCDVTERLLFVCGYFMSDLYIMMFRHISFSHSPYQETINLAIHCWNKIKLLVEDRKLPNIAPVPKVIAGWFYQSRVRRST